MEVKYEHSGLCVKVGCGGAKRGALALFGWDTTSESIALIRACRSQEVCLSVRLSVRLCMRSRGTRGSGMLVPPHRQQDPEHQPPTAP